MTDEETTQLIERLLTRSEGLERVIESLDDLHDFESADDSPAAEETQTIENPNPGWGVDPVEGTQLFASVFMTAAHAGLEPLRRVLKPPSLAWAPYVLARRSAASPLSSFLRSAPPGTCTSREKVSARPRPAFGSQSDSLTGFDQWFAPRSGQLALRWPFAVAGELTSRPSRLVEPQLVLRNDRTARLKQFASKEHTRL